MNTIRHTYRQLLYLVMLTCLAGMTAVQAMAQENATPQDTNTIMRVREDRSRLLQELQQSQRIVKTLDEKTNLYENNAPLCIRYTKNHPLVIVADWHFSPYSYVNDHGKPDGFNIDIFQGIFTRLHVPYTIKSVEWRQAKRELSTGKASVMIDVQKPDDASNLHYSSYVLGEYPVAAIHAKSEPNLRSIVLLNSKDTICLCADDYADQYLQRFFDNNIPFHVEYLNPYTALQDVASGRKKYFIWGRLAMEKMVAKYGMADKVQIDNIDIPNGQLRFVSTDTLLLHELDQQMMQMESLEQYDDIRQKWFSANYQPREKNNMIEITIIVTFILILVALLVITIVVHRNGVTGNLKEEFRIITDNALHLSSSDVIVINVRKQTVENIAGNFLPEGPVPYEVYRNLIHPDDLKIENEAHNVVDGGTSDMPTLHLRMRKYEDPSNEWRMMSVHAFVKSSNKNKPLYVYLVLVDDTERIEEQKQLDHILREFANITELSDLGMAYYDRRGRLINLNKALLNIFNKGGSNKAEQFLHRINMNELIVILNGIIIEENIDAWVCAPLDIPELNLHTTVELRIKSIFNDKHEHRGYTFAMVDLQDKIATKRSESAIAARLAAIGNSLTHYQLEMRYIMRKHNIKTLRWKRGNDYFEISRDLLSFDRKVPFSYYHENVTDDDRSNIENFIKNPDEVFSKPFHQVRNYRGDKNDITKTRWFSVDMIPEYDETGNFIGAFGIWGDITDFVETRKMLEQEARKAADSGRQKAVFLANMTHELRTPLNAINGFAEVMKIFSTPDEKKEYIDIMRRNCNMLISLIDNILQLSTIDTEGLKLTKRSLDFAIEFPKAVKCMEHYMNNPEVKFLVDQTYPTLTLEVDFDRIVQVVDAFVNNAAKFTQKGFVRVGYRFVNGTLTVYCRDTGCGIPKERQQDVFHRFVKLDDFVPGTGLGLALCQRIAQEMGATIDLYSREGEGTTISLNLNV